MSGIGGSTLRVMSIVRTITLGIRFLCELGMLSALAVWGAHVGEGGGAVALAVGLPLAAAGFWGAFVAPKARWPVPLGARVAIELGLFGAASLALWSAGFPAFASVLALLALVTVVLNAMQERSGEPVPGARGVD
jgi:hypothetical protein